MDRRCVVLLLLACAGACSQTPSSQDAATDALAGDGSSAQDAVASDASANGDAAAGQDVAASDAAASDDAAAPDAASPGDGGSPVDIPGWTLVFDDEFEGTGPDLDPSKHWSVYSGPQGNAPDFSHFEPEQTYVDHGVLRLKIEHRTADGDPYVCGGLETSAAQAQTYGRWVVRARFPAGRGNVGYMGLFGTGTTEIDFGEVAGRSPLENSFTQHYGAGSMDQHTLTGTDSTADFHEYTVVWETNSLVWLVDGVEQYRTDQRFTNEDLVFALGDWAAPCTIEWAGCPDATTAYPAYMDIDYVRIYRR